MTSGVWCMMTSKIFEMITVLDHHKYLFFNKTFVKIDYRLHKQKQRPSTQIPNKRRETGLNVTPRKG